MRVICVILFIACFFETTNAFTPLINEIQKKLGEAKRFRGRLSLNGSAWSHVLENPTRLISSYLRDWDSLALEDRVSQECYEMHERFMADLELGLPYAARVMDSWGKVPAGLASYNPLWFGAFDQCVETEKSSARAEDHFRAQYCLHYVIGKTFYPVQWGSCVAEACTAEEVNMIFIHEIIASDMPIDFIFYTMGCNNDIPWTTGATVSIVVIGVLVLLSLMGTAYDSLLHIGIITSRLAPESITKQAQNSALRVHDKVHMFFISFSWITNGRKLMSTEVRAKETASLNGMRAFSMFWVVFGHTAFFLIFISDNLYPFAEDIVTELSWQVITYATVSVDSFFFLSGFLVSYLILKEMHKKKGQMHWALVFFHRFWRLTPLYMFIVMIHGNLTPHMFRGPGSITWSQSDDIKNCVDDWWTMLLYINNFTADRMSGLCAGWTWYLQIDMQLFLISPIVLAYLYRKPIAGFIIWFILLMTNLITLGVVSHDYKLSPLITAEFNETQSRIKDHTYIRPYYRMAPYLVGMLLAYILLKKDFKIKMPKIVALLGWVLAAACNLSVIYGLYHYHDTEANPYIDPDLGYFFYTTHRFAWSLGLAWVIFACSTGYGGPVNVILSWGLWMPIGRLAYAMYLIHELFIYVYLGSTQVPIHVTPLNITMYFLAWLTGTALLAFVASMLVEAPFMGLEKLILPPSKSSTRSFVDTNTQTMPDSTPNTEGKLAAVENDYIRLRTDAATTTDKSHYEKPTVYQNDHFTTGGNAVPGNSTMAFKNHGYVDSKESLYDSIRL